MEGFTPIRIVFTYSQGDAALFQAWLVKRKKKRPLWIRVGVVVVPLVILAGIQIYLQIYPPQVAMNPRPVTAPANKEVEGTLLRTFFPCFSACGLLTCLLVYLAWYNRKQWAQRMQGTHTVEFSEDGVDWKGPSSQSKYAWDHFERFVESPKGFLLMGKPSTLMLPKRVMTSEQVVALRKLLELRFGGAAPSISIQ